MTARRTRTIENVDMLRIERMPNSYYGDPRYLIVTDQGSYRTEPNASLGYELPNWFGRYHEHDRHHVTLHLNGRDHVYHVTPERR